MYAFVHRGLGCTLEGRVPSILLRKFIFGLDRANIFFEKSSVGIDLLHFSKWVRYNKLRKFEIRPAGG